MSDQAPRNIERLIEVMSRLRDPDSGCAWDIEQTFETIAPYTIEEAYEVAEAIRNNDMAELKEELGDLLLQVVYHARMAEEDGAFDFDAVAKAIGDKMVRRHPHVFGDHRVETAAAQSVNWEAMKAAERKAKANPAKASSILDGVATGLPGTTRAYKLQARAARVGFDWPEAAPVFGKIEEELDEIREAMANGGAPDRVKDEVGDLLFAVINLARHLEVDPESALRSGNAKFERRFRAIEAAMAARQRPMKDASLAEMEAAWQAAKQGEI